MFKLDQTCSNWIILVWTWSQWINVVQNGSNWFKLDHCDKTCSNLIKIDQTWSNWIKIDQIGLNLIQIDQTWPNKFKHVQSDLIMIGFLAVMTVWQKLLFGQKYFCQIWSAFFARNGFFPMNLPYFSKYWKVWLVFNGWKLSGLFNDITDINKTQNFN